MEHSFLQEVCSISKKLINVHHPMNDTCFSDSPQVQLLGENLVVKKGCGQAGDGPSAGLFSLTDWLKEPQQEIRPVGQS